MLSADQIKSGDILLCHKSDDYVARKIEEKTGSKYCHAAIYYGDSEVAESLALDGFKKGKIGKESLDNLVARYDHVAVLRQPDAWVSAEQVNSLKLFIDKTIANGAKYNLLAIPSFVSRKELHEQTLYDKLDAFFKEELPEYSPEKSNYFCSEFVCDCFIATGFIDQSAAILYQSDVYAPGDLGSDPTFGTFLGYLTSDDSYTVPTDDVFYMQSTFGEIFGS
ncbi:hypothetical protein ABXV24_24890 [Vibrio owensii]|uniref:hypothetical protein n=1 Tax=Vibrio owensii TaxID=696485 RepID=UPI00339B7D35